MQHMKVWEETGERSALSKSVRKPRCSGVIQELFNFLFKTCSSSLNIRPKYCNGIIPLKESPSGCTPTKAVRPVGPRVEYYAM